MVLFFLNENIYRQLEQSIIQRKLLTLKLLTSQKYGTVLEMGFKLSCVCALQPEPVLYHACHQILLLSLCFAFLFFF